jgi:hypothetical protein
VKEMVPFSFVSIEDFLKETDEVGELLKLAISRYERVSLMKLNKKLNELSNEVRIHLDEAIEKINKNYDRTIEYIHAQGEEVSKELKEYYQKEVDYNENIDLLEFIETQLDATGIDERQVDLAKEDIDSMESSLKTINSISKRMKDKRKEIEEGIIELKKVFDIKYDGDGEILNASLSAVMDGYNPENLYNNLLTIFKENGLLEGIDVHVKKEDGIKKLETYYKLFEKEEIEVFEFLKSELTDYQKLKNDTLRVSISLLKDNGVDCADIKDISKVKRAMEKLIEDKKKRYEDIKAIFKKRMDLVRELDAVDADALSEKTDELSEKLQSYIDKMEEVEKKKIIH